MTHYPTVLLATENELDSVYSLDGLKEFVAKRITHLSGDSFDSPHDYFFDWYSLDSYYAKRTGIHHAQLELLDVLMVQEHRENFFHNGVQIGPSYILPEPGWIKTYLFCDDFPFCIHRNHWPLCYKNPHWKWPEIVDKHPEWWGIFLDVHR